MDIGVASPALGASVRGGRARPLDLRRTHEEERFLMSNLETVRTMLACFSAGDPQGQLDRCTDDVVYEAPYYGLERHGKDELAAMLHAVQERFESVSYVIVDDFPTVDPDLVIVEVRGDNQVRGGERRYQNHYVMFLHFRDGLVQRWREFSNPDVYRTAVSS
jgi:ketosteroid isomerase-like protein